MVVVVNRQATCATCGGLFETSCLCAYNGEQYCGPCIEDTGLTLCDGCGTLFNENGIIVCNGECRCAPCARSAGWAQCRDCDRWLVRDDQYQNEYCSACFYNRFTHCAGCDNWFDRNTMIGVDGELYCSYCVSTTRDFDPAGFHNRSGCTTKIGSERCFGVELETNDCAGFDGLSKHGAWGAKNDPTCAGKEFYSDILYGDEGLEAVADLSELAYQNDWTVGRSCGYHLHIDMRQENDDSLYAAAYAYCATQEVWRSFVANHRHHNSYCHPLEWDCLDIDRLTGIPFWGFMERCALERYNWINLQAYERHSTFEIRLHHASLSEQEVCNWIKAHTRFVDWATTLGLAGVKEKLDGKSNSEKFDIIAREAWADEELCNYYANKRATETCGG